MKTVCFVNMKGGVAKTTLAVNVAYCVASRHDFRVLVIDLDPQFNATQCLLDGETYKDHLESGGHTVVQLFDDTPRLIISATKAPQGSEVVKLEDIRPINIRPNMDLLPGALELHRLDMAGGQGREMRLKRYIESLADSEYDLVIIDTPPTPSAWMSAALIASDYYLVPVKSEPLSATGIELLNSIIKSATENYNLKIRRAGLVFTITEEHTRVHQEAEKFVGGSAVWKGELYSSNLMKRTEIAREQTNQKLILDLGDSKLKSSLANITKEFLRRIDLES